MKQRHFATLVMVDEDGRPFGEPFSGWMLILASDGPLWRATYPGGDTMLLRGVLASEATGQREVEMGAWRDRDFWALILTSVLIGVLAVGSFVFSVWMARWRYAECLQVGHSMTYCQVTQPLAFPW